jgi:UDP-N-acetylmuramate dehydrogenase
MKLCGFSHITKENFLLSLCSSMKTGGRAKYAFFPENESDFIGLADALSDEKNVYVIGNATNVLFPDDASNLYIIFTTKMTGIRSLSDTEFFVRCGNPLTGVSSFATREGLAGLEFAYGIPGNVGGSVFMNAGAYGGELSQVIKSVSAYDRNKKELVTLSREECGFGYRDSIFMHRKELLILGATFALSRGNKEEIEKKCRENMQARRDKQPLEFPSCGSAFKRPEGHFAGKLIEDCGLKGVSVGGAQVSEKHAGFIINRENATSSDVLSLMELVTERVKEKFGVTLCPEIEIIKETEH